MGALDGYKILDFTTLLPGPYATMTLADMGAEVLKISGKDKYDLVVNWPPVVSGTQVTGVQAWLGRNKKTMFLNLKKPKAVEAVKKLVAEYDIVVEQFRPGVMDKLGVGYEALREVNPKLIYCAITGYGQDGPFAMKAGHDINYLSRSGIAWAAGRRESGPSLYNFRLNERSLRDPRGDHLPRADGRRSVHRRFHAGQRHSFQLNGRSVIFCRRTDAGAGERTSERRRDL